MSHDFSIVQLMLNASWVVQAVVALLVTMSVISWAAIFRKLSTLKRVRALNDDMPYARFVQAVAARLGAA